MLAVHHIACSFFHPQWPWRYWVTTTKREIGMGNLTQEQYEKFDELTTNMEKELNRLANTQRDLWVLVDNLPVDEELQALRKENDSLYEELRRYKELFSKISSLSSGC